MESFRLSVQLFLLEINELYILKDNNSFHFHRHLSIENAKSMYRIKIANYDNGGIKMEEQ